jgi:choline dehydrogenase-like flavoprotein
LKEDIGNFRIQLSPRDSVPGIDSLKSLIEWHGDWETFSEIGYHIANILVDIDQVANVVYKSSLHRSAGFLNRPSGSRIKHSGAIMHVSAEQIPNPESRVELSDETDVFGQQRLKLTWRLHDAHRRTLASSFRLFAAAVSASGYGRVRLPSELGEPAQDSLVEIACHHMGTTRMSNDPKTGVVDGNCKVHGIDNLYIASSSVFSTGSWVNRTLTIIALALRLADHLKTRYG